MFSLSFDVGGLLDDVFDFSGNQERADKQLAQQDLYNQRSFNLDKDKFLYAKQRQTYEDKRADSALQRLAKDANAAGLSVASVLGTSGASPASVSIPGHTGARVAGNTFVPRFGNRVLADMQFKSANEKSRDRNSALEQQFNADIAYWNAKKAQQDYQIVEDKTGVLPKRYQLYSDNTQEAMDHIRNGGYVIPTGASMELPETLGAYEYGRPYIKEEDFLRRIDQDQNPNRYNIGIMP